MRATLLLTEKTLFEDGSILELRIWAVPSPVPPATHAYKYRLFYGRPGQRLVAYDNERGKGDHKHVLGVEIPYGFVSIRQLLQDFRTDVEALRGTKI
jgi:hypothetical protein